MLTLGSRCLCNAVRVQPLFVRRTPLRLLSYMYADREPRQRYAQYRANAAEFGMGTYRRRNRSPPSISTRAAATDADTPNVDIPDAVTPDEEPVTPAQVEITVARRVYVGNLAFSVSWQDLKDHFKTMGPVVHAHVGGAKGVRRSKGWGIVTYETPEDAAAAIQQLDQSELQGRQIFVREDRDDYDLPKNSSASPEGSPRGTGPRPDRRSDRPYDSGVLNTGTRLFVTNLNPQTTWKELKDYFRICGSVTYATVFTGEDGQSKCLGVVQYEHQDQAQRAIRELNATDLDGQKLFVREDQQDYSGTAERLSPGANRAGRNIFRPPRGVNVIVQGLPFSYGWQDLKDMFRPVGGVLSTDIVMGRDGRSRGWGVVTMETEEDAQRAIQELHGQNVQGRFLGVKLDERADDYTRRSPPSRPTRNPNTSIAGRQIRVQGLPPDYAWQDLKDTFKPFGAIRADIAEGSATGTVRFPSAEAAEKAVQEMQDTTVGGQAVEIEIDPLTQSGV